MFCHWSLSLVYIFNIVYQISYEEFGCILVYLVFLYIHQNLIFYFKHFKNKQASCRQQAALLCSCIATPSFFIPCFRQQSERQHHLRTFPPPASSFQLPTLHWCWVSFQHPDAIASTLPEEPGVHKINLKVIWNHETKNN